MIWLGLPTIKFMKDASL